MFELGETAEEIAQAFSTTVPRNGTVFTADEQTAQLMWSCCEEKKLSAAWQGIAPLRAEVLPVICLDAPLRLVLGNAQLLRNSEGYLPVSFDGPRTVFCCFAATFFPFT